MRHDAQEVAQFLLGGQSGSITVIEPATGAIRAMYSNPTFDPNTFVNADFAVAQEVITDLQNTPPETRCSPRRTRSGTCPARRSR